MLVETHTKKLDRRAWEGRLVGYSVDSKSFRVYDPATRSSRESRNVTFTETPSVTPELELVSGFNDGDVTYDEYDYMVRDVRNYTSNLDFSSPPAANREVQDPSVRDLPQTIRQTTKRDAAASRNRSDPPRLHLSTTHRMTRLGGTALLRLSKAALQGQVVVWSRMVAPVFRRLVLHREVDVALRWLRFTWWKWCTRWPRSTARRRGRGGSRRNVLIPDRLHKHLTPRPSANCDD